MAQILKEKRKEERIIYAYVGEKNEGGSNTHVRCSSGLHGGGRPPKHL